MTARTSKAFKIFIAFFTYSILLIAYANAQSPVYVSVFEDAKQNSSDELLAAAAAADYSDEAQKKIQSDLLKAAKEKDERFDMMIKSALLRGFDFKKTDSTGLSVIEQLNKLKKTPDLQTPVLFPQFINLRKSVNLSFSGMNPQEELVRIILNAYNAGEISLFGDERLKEEITQQELLGRLLHISGNKASDRKPSDELILEVHPHLIALNYEVRIDEFKAVRKKPVSVAFFSYAGEGLQRRPVAFAELEDLRKLFRKPGMPQWTNYPSKSFGEIPMLTYDPLIPFEEDRIGTLTASVSQLFEMAKSGLISFYSLSGKEMKAQDWEHFSTEKYISIQQDMQWNASLRFEGSTPAFVDLYFGFLDYGNRRFVASLRFEDFMKMSDMYLKPSEKLIMSYGEALAEGLWFEGINTTPAPEYLKFKKPYQKGKLSSSNKDSFFIRFSEYAELQEKRNTLGFRKPKREFVRILLDAVQGGELQPYTVADRYGSEVRKMTAEEFWTAANTEKFKEQQGLQMSDEETIEVTDGGVKPMLQISQPKSHPNRKKRASYREDAFFSRREITTLEMVSRMHFDAGARVNRLSTQYFTLIVPGGQNPLKTGLDFALASFKAEDVKKVLNNDPRARKRIKFENEKGDKIKCKGLWEFINKKYYHAYFYTESGVMKE